MTMTATLPPANPPATPPAAPTARPTRHPAAALKQPNILAIPSGKGGVGKTWLSVPLAHCLARQRQRGLLFGGDIVLANVDIHTGPQIAIASFMAHVFYFL